MPFLKFSRDKRGYENFYLIEPPSGGRRGGKSRPRVLFWFRTPPQVKVGRVPFSDEVQKLIEAQNPGLTFDWPRIINTPIPPPDISDHWRERRRQEKAAKRAAREDVEAEAEAEQPPQAAAAEAAPVAPPADAAEVVAVDDGIAAAVAAEETDGGHIDDSAERVDEADEVDEADGSAPAETPLAASDATGTVPGASTAPPEQRRRRRRRRGRRGRPAQPGAPAPPIPDAPAEASSPEAPSTDEV